MRIGGEDATNLRDPVEVAETDEQKEASDLLASHSLDYAQTLRVKNMLEFLHVYRRLSPSAALVETILAEDYAHNAVLSSLFGDYPLLKGVGSNRAIAFFSARSAHVNKVLAALTKVGSQIFTVFSLSPETSFDPLMVAMTSTGNTTTALSTRRLHGTTSSCSTTRSTCLPISPTRSSLCSAL